MPINASIPLGVEPVQLPDFASLAVKRASVMNTMSEMATRQRALNEQNALAQVVQSPGYDPTDPEWRKRTAFVAPNLGSDFLKAQDDAAAAATAREKAMREETTAKQMTAFQRLLSFKSGEEARADAQSHFKDYEPGVGQSIIEGIPTDPAEFDKWRVSHMQRILQMVSPDKALETEHQNVDLGGKVEQQAWNKYGGQPPTGTLTKTMTPDQAADNARQTNTDRVTSQRPFGFQGQTGDVTMVSPDGKRIIAQFQGISKPTGGFEKAEAARGEAYKQISSAEKVVSELLLPNSDVDKAKGGGITTAQSTLAGLLGMTTPEMEAQAKLGPIGYVLLQQVPRFEGPQSDKDTAAYKDAAGKLQDPMSTALQKRAALMAIKELLTRQRAYLDSNPQRGAATTGAPAAGGITDGGEYELVNGKLVLKK